MDESNRNGLRIDTMRHWESDRYLNRNVSELLKKFSYHDIRSNGESNLLSMCIKGGFVNLAKRLIAWFKSGETPGAGFNDVHDAGGFVVASHFKLTADKQRLEPFSATQSTRLIGQLTGDERFIQVRTVMSPLVLCTISTTMSECSPAHIEVFKYLLAEGRGQRDSFYSLFNEWNHFVIHSAIMNGRRDLLVHLCDHLLEEEDFNTYTQAECRAQLEKLLLMPSKTGFARMIPLHLAALLHHPACFDGRNIGFDNAGRRLKQIPVEQVADETKPNGLERIQECRFTGDTHCQDDKINDLELVLFVLTQYERCGGLKLVGEALACKDAQGRMAVDIIRDGIDHCQKMVDDFIERNPHSNVENEISPRIRQFDEKRRIVAELEAKAIEAAKHCL